MLSMQCDCVQKQHSAPIETIEVSENASDKVVEILKNYNRIFLVADENTYEVLGKKVEKLLKDAGKLSHTCILENPCLPTNANIGRVLIEAGIDDEVYDINAFSTNPDYILAVGSGSVNDICRMVSYRIGVEYGVVGTAPSMDGYVSVVAPLLVGRKKLVYTCSTARHIIIDLNVCFWTGSCPISSPVSITAKKLPTWYLKQPISVSLPPFVFRTEKSIPSRIQ